MEDFIGRRGDGTVGGFGNNFRLDVLGVVSSDDVFKRGRNQDVAFVGEQILVGDRQSLGQSDDRSVCGLMGDRLIQIDAVFTKDASLAVADGDDFGSRLGKRPARDEADIAHTLNANTGP